MSDRAFESALRRQREEIDRLRRERDEAREDAKMHEAALSGAEQMRLLRLALEFDKAPDDAEWEPPHPIFQMALDIDNLRARCDRLREALQPFVDAYERAGRKESWASSYLNNNAWERARAALQGETNGE